MARVSVIVPARNAEATLGQTLASIAAQTYTDWEVVVVDDGSTDATADIARSFAGALVLLSHSESMGPSAARNTAARRAGGELLAMLDADDEWRPGYLAHVVGRYDDACARGRRVGLVTCDAELVAEDGPVGQTHQARVGVKLPVTLDQLLRRNVLTPMALCPRDVFFAAGGYDERLAFGEEYDLWIRIAEMGYEIVTDPDVLAVYRMHRYAASTDTVRLAEGAAFVCRLALDRGALSGRRRRIVRRQMRTHMVVAERARLAAARREGRASPRQWLRFGLMAAVAAAEHPDRWWRWLRRGPRQADGVARHVWAGETGRVRARRRA